MIFEQSGPVLGGLLVDVMQALLAGQRRGKQDDIRMTDTVLDDHGRARGIEMLGDFQAERQIEAPVQIDVTAQVEMQDEAGIDRERVLAEDFHLKAEDGPGGGSGQASQPVAGAASQIEDALEIEPSLQDRAHGGRCVPGRFLQPPVFGKMRGNGGIIHEGSSGLSGA